MRRIGAGGMGEVFLAREGGEHPRACVVKKVLPNLVANRAFVGRFLDEAKVVVRLKHTNIARVYAMGDVGGEYFLTMEYVQGKTVSRFTKRLRDRKAEMPLGLILLLGEKVCQGLEYAHHAKDESGSSLHLVHRDLSPANVCISYRGDVKIIDFGAAQSTLKEEQTAPRVVIGNLTYMAPEQAKKLIVDGRADVYSCGVMLWELLAWHALPQKGDPIERWRRAANPSWEGPSKHNRSVPRGIDDVILKALKKEPSERWSSAAEFGEALKKARLRHAPDVTERDLGELLSRVFHKEKASEDEVLTEAIYGKTVTPLAGDKTRRLALVPPTALAFEHTAVLAPADILKANDDATDPERPDPTVADEGTPTPARDPRLSRPLREHLREQRKSFGLSFGDVQEPLIEESLIQEIEATGDEEPYRSGEGDTAAYERAARWQRAALFGGVFFVALGLGFLGVWLALR
ncbi:MAG: serine/threonine protein kinase [Myxococcaceae bacterium]|nr:serine/threonine protein kinase [Myxococcaceae bacterium]MCA3011789.1 serine/threonine protein kinase [Myxococcaceae bacterium]